MIEWENAKLSEFERSRCMLAALGDQLRSLRSRLDRPPELLLLHDRFGIDAKRLEEAVAEALPEPDLAVLRFVATDGQGYYQQKNAGAALASHEIVVFLDSDVVPRPEWLVTLLEAIADPNIEVVGGATFLSPDSFLNRAFSLFWLFSPEFRERDQGELRRSNHFFANNVAFRRALITARPFPDLPTSRGQCTMLAQELLASGHRIYLHEQARVEHPPPNGLAHLARRAMNQGRDDYLLANEREPHRYRSRLANTLWRFRKRIVRAARRIAAHGRTVGLSGPGLAGAALVAAGYYAFYLVGLVVTLFDRDAVARFFPI